MTDIRDELTDMNPEALLADGFDGALVGYAVVNDRPIALYSAQKIIDQLMKQDGLTEEEAIEHFEFNIVGGYHGPNTPLFHWFRWEGVAESVGASDARKDQGNQD